MDCRGRCIPRETLLDNLNDTTSSKGTTTMLVWDTVQEMWRWCKENVDVVFCCCNCCALLPSSFTTFMFSQMYSCYRFSGPLFCILHCLSLSSIYLCIVASFVCLYMHKLLLLLTGWSNLCALWLLHIFVASRLFFCLFSNLCFARLCTSLPPYFVLLCGLKSLWSTLYVFRRVVPSPIVKSWCEQRVNVSILSTTHTHISRWIDS